MGRGTEVIAALKELHSDRDVDGCLTASENAFEFVVLENKENIACIKQTNVVTGFEGFSVSNPKRRYINLLATDHCFFPASDYEEKCDFVIFDDIYFCFVELKLNVNPRNAANNIRKARGQLGTTLTFFRDSFSQKSKRFFNYNLEAYIVMKTHTYPKHSAGKQGRRVRFQDEYGVKLFEQNFKEFDK